MTSARLSNSDASKMQNSLIRWIDYILFKNLDGKYLTLKDCIEENKKPRQQKQQKPGNQKTEKTDGEQAEEKRNGKDNSLSMYTDEIQQSQYINMFKEQGMDAVILKHNIDTAFITHRGAET